jgi:putative transport protein
MEVNLYDLFADSPLILVFTVLGLGLLVGHIRVGPTQLGSTIGVLLVGLVFGHFGLTINEMVGTFGFALFIFSVGLQAGPSFFSAFRADGSRYILLSLLVAVSGVALTVVFARVLDLPAGLDAGILAGALTSTPSLAGAQDAFLSGLGNLGGLTVEQARQNVSIGYAITYLGGTAGVIALVRTLPRLLKVDLQEEAKTLERQRGLAPKRRAVGPAALPVIRAYEVAPEDSRTIAQARHELGLPAVPLRVKRGDEFVEPAPEFVLEKGDVVSIFAGLDVHRHIQDRLGQEVLDPVLLNYAVDTREIIVLNDSAVGQTLDEQDLVGKHGCFATAVTRSGIELPFGENIVLNRGDRRHVTGERSRLEAAASALGHIEEEVEETDLVTFSFGIAAGVAIGLILIKVGNVSIGLGMAGGLLITGILIGYASSLNPTVGRVPQPARYLLMELGLMLFMARVGLNAGGGIVEALIEGGPTIIACGLAIALVPALFAYSVGRHLMKMNPALLLGSVTGAMTSTPALNVLNEAARSPVPALGYAGTYTIANVLLTFAGAVVAML